MIDWAPLHPQVVHFVVALGLVGIVLRLISLTGRAVWTRPAGAVLLILAAVSSVVAVKSGTAAHGPVERIPGAREAVEHHEEAGETTRNLFLVVGVIEVAGLALASREKARRWLMLASAVAGVVACVELYEAADEGGELVYAYGGGPGLRSGDPADVQRLLVAGLYAQAAAARDSGRTDEAARLTDELVRQRPNDPAVTLLAIQSLIRDRHDPAGALATLDTLKQPEGNRRWDQQVGLLRGEALVAAGQPDSARAVLTGLVRKYPDSRGVQRALEQVDSQRSTVNTQP
ncbi:MAG TPA: DUF2231 domain-containing protein [Gemmatimonadales bacterium]|jgi:uncharacterized membrane protein|nr:DUF2231 domain-containing protein [Gemmatimonadales bacterium]